MTIKTTNKSFVPVVSVILAMMAAMSPFAIDAYLPAMPDMSKAFGVGISKVQITVTIYFLGFALGNFVGGPVSDSFGRKSVALTGIVLYGISAILIPLVSGIEAVWVLRFTQAFGGGFATVTAAVFVKDWFKGKQVARMMTIIAMIMMLAPLFAPIIGAGLVKEFHWQGVFYFLTLFAVLLLLLVGGILPESRKNEYLTRQISFKQLAGRYRPFFQSQKAVLMLLAISFSSSGLFVFITTASFLYMEYYEVSTEVFPFLFAANIGLNILLSLLNTLFLKKFSPEMLLAFGMVLQLIGGLAIFLVTVFSSAPPFEVVFPAIVLFIGALGLIFGNGTAIVLNELPHISGTANATIGLTRFLLSFVVGTIPSLFGAHSIAPIGVTMFVCVLVANVFVYFFMKAPKTYALS